MRQTLRRWPVSCLIQLIRTMHIPFDNTYKNQLAGFYTPWRGETWLDPKIIKLNRSLANELNLRLDNIDSETLATIFSGHAIPEGAEPLVQVYAGHQFGSFNPQLGDGRALLLGEIVTDNGQRFDIQLKGSGKTPYSRNGDGKSALGPVLREYIVSEAMHHLGIPTTRSLAAVATGDQVYREAPLPGAVLTRVASSHIRVGTFQYFAARNEYDKVRQLADYAIARHYPDLQEHEARYPLFLQSVCQAQATLIAKWMSVGFIHGVMNTDNTTISGETIDYGPCAFMEQYDPETVYSSIDVHGRYQYQNQPSIGVWNLSRLADCLLPLFDENHDTAIEQATEILEKFPQMYYSAWLYEMREKIGLSTQAENDMELVQSMLTSMQDQSVDYTLFFRYLVNAVTGENQDVQSLFNNPVSADAWLELWRDRLASEGRDSQAVVDQMSAKNPIYIPRNHLVEEALNAATDNQDYHLFETLLEVLSTPTTRQSKRETYENPAPDSFGPYQTFCGT